MLHACPKWQESGNRHLIKIKIMNRQSEKRVLSSDCCLERRVRLALFGLLVHRFDGFEFSIFTV